MAGLRDPEWVAHRLIHGASAERADAVERVMAALWGDGTPPKQWWTTPVGRAVILAGDGQVSGYRAAQALGVTPGYIGQLVASGRLERHSDGGVDAGSLRALAAERAAR